jgi:hypothetical protein
MPISNEHEGLSISRRRGVASLNVHLAGQGKYKAILMPDNLFSNASKASQT